MRSRPCRVKEATAGSTQGVGIGVDGSCEDRAKDRSGVVLEDGAKKAARCRETSDVEDGGKKAEDFELEIDWER